MTSTKCIANVRYILRCFCLRSVCFFLASPIKDSCSWPYDKTYDTRSFVGHGNRTTLGAAPSCDIFNLGFVIFSCPTHYRASSVECRAGCWNHRMSADQARTHGDSRVVGRPQGACGRRVCVTWDGGRKLPDMKLQDLKMQGTKLQDSYCFVRTFSAIDA